MQSQSLNYSQFESLINEYEIVFVDFWAAWCSPCKQFARIYDSIAAEFPNIDFIKVNIEEQQELAECFNIRSIPHLMVFKDASVIYSEAGNLSEAILKKVAQEALDL